VQSYTHWEQQSGKAVKMRGKNLTKTEIEKDVGVHISSNLKPTEQCKKAATKATQVLNQILWNFHYRDRIVFVGLYKKYVRPHLEFASPAWSPWMQSDISLIEKSRKEH
jgi:hypothetical protein